MGARPTMPFEPEPSATTRSPAASIPGRDPAPDAAASARALVERAGLVLKQVEADPALISLLALNGFGAPALDAGTALSVAAETQIAACEDACHAYAALVAEREALWLAAREEYLEFRETVRTLLAEPRLRRSLGVNGMMEPELVGFVAQALASYQAAATAPVGRRLAGRSFDRERIAAARERLKQLLELEQLVAVADRKRREAADERKLALGMLNLWTEELLKSLRQAFGRICRPPARASGAGARQAPGDAERRAHQPVRRTRPPGPEAT